MSRESDYLRDVKRKAETTVEVPHLVYLSAPYTSAAFNGGGFSTTAKTKIDLSATFSAGGLGVTFVPDYVKSVLLKVGIADSASSGADAYIVLSPNSTAGEGMTWRIRGWTSGTVYYTSMTVPCDSGGDIYYQTVATGAGTMTIILQVWGWVL